MHTSKLYVWFWEVLKLVCTEGVTGDRDVFISTCVSLNFSLQ